MNPKVNYGHSWCFVQDTTCVCMGAKVLQMWITDSVQPHGL